MSSKDITTVNIAKALSGYKSEARWLIRDALIHGWEANLTANQHVMLRHPDGRSVTLSRTLSSKNRAWQNAVASLYREAVTEPLSEGGLLYRYDLEVVTGILIATTSLGFTGGVSATGDVILTATATGQTIRVRKSMTGEHLRIEIARKAPRSAQLAALASSAEQWEQTIEEKLAERDGRLPETEITFAPSKPRKPRHTKEAQPMTTDTIDLTEVTPVPDQPGQYYTQTFWKGNRAPGADGQRTDHESKIILERTYTDGKVEYVCIGCGFVAETPRAVAGHYSRSNVELHPRVHKAYGKRAKAETPPKTIKAKAKAKALEAAPKPLPVVLPTVEVPALPAAEVLNRIRDLLGMTAEMVQLRAEVTRLKEELAIAEAKARACEVQTLEAESKITSLKELIAEL